MRAGRQKNSLNRTQGANIYAAERGWAESRFKRAALEGKILVASRDHWSLDKQDPGLSFSFLTGKMTKKEKKKSCLA